MFYTRVREEDIVPMGNLGYQMYKEGAFKELDWDFEKVHRLTKRYIEKPNTHFALCAYDDENLVGMIMGYLTPYYFGNDILATDHLWYVDPEYRGTRVGLKLLKDFRSWAIKSGAKEVCIGISTGTDVDRTGALLERLGFNHVGGTYKATS